jgi:hypothetical protein
MQRSEDRERVPSTVRPPRAVVGGDPELGRFRSEGQRHPDLTATSGTIVEHEHVSIVEFAEQSV